ncbi:MAG: methyltransferase domain-containing protein, partial [Verrucomicrobia bacterium]|nr:methyltransferase domain-containing protein [Verrucomicrobiota bacterium]
MIRRNKPWPIAPVITAMLLLGCVFGFAQSPVNQWVFSPENIDITTVKDLSGNEDGLLHGRMVPTKNPPALYFDGTDTYVELAGKDEAKSLPKSKLTAEAWVAVNSPAEWGGIVGSLQDNGSFEKGWVLGYNNDKFNFALSTGGDLTYLNASDSFQTGRWYHVVGTYDGSLMRIYVNGTERGRSSNRRGTIDYSPAAFVIGCYLDDNEFYPLEGFISEVRLYNRTLTSQQVRTRYNRTKGSHTSRPKPPVALTNRELSAGPYLAFTSPDEAVVRWETAKPMPTHLAYGTTPTLQNRIDLPKKTRQHEVLLPGIEPGAIYQYSVGVEQDGQTQWLAPATAEADFNYSRPVITGVESPFAEDERMRKSRAAAESIVAATGIRKGYAIDYGCGEGRLAFALAKRTELTVIGVTADADEAARARAAVRRAGIYGTRVIIHHRRLAKLSHTDHMFNLAVSSELLHHDKLPGDRAELLRVLRPSGGVLALGGLPQSGLAKLITGSPLARGTTTESSGELLLAKRKPLDGAGKWTHTYGTAAQTANSGDKIVNGGKMALQWFGKPGARGMIDRQGRNPPPLTSNGFLYVQGDNRIWGQDAFNGTILWNYEFPSELRRVNTPRDGSNMCSDDSSLFVAMRDRAYRFDGQTGRLLRSFPVISNGAANWGYIANDDGLLFGGSVKPGSEYTKFKGTPYWYDSSGTQDTAKVCSDNLFAIDKQTGSKKWEYSGGKIINTTIAIGGGRVYF